MNSLERCLAAFEHRKTDKIPVHHIQFSGHAAHVILGRKACVGGAFNQFEEMQALWAGPDAHAAFVKQAEEDAVAIAKACGHDLLRLNYWRWRGGRPAKRIDEYAFLFGDPNGYWFTETYVPEVEQLIRKSGVGSNPAAGQPEEEITEEALRKRLEAEERKLEEYRPPEGPDPRLKSAGAKYRDFMLKEGTEPITLNAMATGELIASALYPDLYARVLMTQARRIAKQMPSLALAGMKVNFSGDDFASKDGPLVSPATMKRVLIPALKLVVDAAHACGIKHAYSSDGHFWPVADLFFNEAGCDGWYEVDKSAGMDLRKLRAKYPHATLVGNIQVQLLQKGTPEDVKREVMETLDAAHELGGIIVGASNMIISGTPPANTEMMLRTIQDNR
jgi:hypothetical protein